MRRIVWLSGLVVVGAATVILLREGIATGMQQIPSGESPAVTRSAAATPPTAAPQARATVIPPSAPTVTEWRTYTHPENKYTFSYPPNWYLETTGAVNAVVILTNYEAKPGAKFNKNTLSSSIKVQISYNSIRPGQPLQEKLAENITGSVDTGKLRSIAPITVAGKTGFKRVLDVLDAYISQQAMISVAFKAEDTRYINIGVYPGKSGHIDDFWKIVESLRLAQ